MILTRLVFLAAFALASPAAATAPEPDPQPDTELAAPHPEALAIAELMLPLETAVDASARVAKQAFFEMFKKNAEMAELESEMPGISAALWPVLEPEIRRFTREEHP